MKTITRLFIICLMGGLTSCKEQTHLPKGQEKKEQTFIQEVVEPKKIDSSKQINLLDEQVRVFNQIFTLAGAEDESPVMGATNYRELIEKMEGSQELKQQLREMYDLYDTGLDPKKKEELKAKISKMLQDGMSKATTEK